MNYSALKAAIAQVVRPNDNQEITGENLQGVFNALVNSIAQGYLFAGVATPSTEPGTPDQNVVYLAGAGSYSNFGASITVNSGCLGIFAFNGEWTKDIVQIGGSIQGIPSVDIAQLNSLGTSTDQAYINPSVYTVTTLHNLSSTVIKVGTLLVFSDAGRSVVTQILFSNYQVDGGGNISSPNTSKITMYYRMYNVSQGSWNAWTLYGGGGGGGTIDPYPVSGSDNAVASNGVFEGLQKAAPEVNINNLDDLGNSVNMRTGEASVYTIKAYHNLSSTWLRVGVLMVFANQAQNTLTQICISNCMVDGGGNLIPNYATNVMNVFYRFKQLSGNPPEGMTIGVWTTWAKFGDSGYQPDNEDIDLNASDQLQFANKLYDASAFSGLGRIYLRKNIVTSGGVEKNVLTQAMVNTSNMIYHIQYDYDLNGQTITLPARCVLEFDGGSVKNGTINGEIIIKSAKTKIFDGITFTGHLISNLQVEWFGAKADGVTDSAPAIRQLIASLPSSNVTIEFSNGEYLQGDGLNSVATEFVFSNKKNIRINGNGATIVANPSNTCVVANKGFQFLFCENIVVDGIVYNGNIEERKPAMGDAGSINSQNAFDIRGCKNVVLRDCQALGAVMDGFFISYESNENELVYSENVILERCLAEKSYRQGVTIRGGNYGVITDCIIRDIGQTAYSTSPQCGIDIEDGYYNGSNGNKILNTTIADCRGAELSLSAGTRNTLVEGCYIKGSIFHNDNNSPTMITGNIISKCTLSNATITSHCAGLSLLDNVVDFSDAAGVNGLFFNNLRNFAIETIDKIEGNTFRYNWSPEDETYSGGKPTTTRGITLQRPLDFEHNVLENFSGTNPIITILSENLATAVRKFNHNTIRSNYDITPYEGTNIATFTGAGGVIRARVYHDNIVEGQYPNMQEGLFDIFNSPNDLRRHYKFPYLQIKGTTWIYDICLGQFSLLKNPTYIRVKVNENTWHLLTKGSNMNMTYTIEKGTSTADLLYSNMYQDDEGNAHILINSTSGGYFYPEIEVFWNGGAYNQKIGQALHMTRRSKTTADGEKTYTAPTATNDIQILSISQADYNNLATKDNNTLYIIV